MKNIYDILAAYNISIPQEQKEAFDKEMAANYRTVPDYEKQTGKVASLTEQLKTATEGLKAFEGVNVEELQGQIRKLQDDLAEKDSQYQRKIADMEFGSLVSSAVTAAKGRNTKAICALLDMDVLKSSKNQETDIKNALEVLKKENGYLFEPDETPPPYAAGTGTNPVNTKYSPDVNAIRAAAGLKTE